MLPQPQINTNAQPMRNANQLLLYSIAFIVVIAQYRLYLILDHRKQGKPSPARLRLLTCYSSEKGNAGSFRQLAPCLPTIALVGNNWTEAPAESPRPLVERRFES